MATLKQLREFFPMAASDEDAISRASQQFGIDPSEIANEVGYDVGGGRLTSKRIGGSLDSYQSGLYETGAAAAGAVGLGGAKAYMERKASDNRLQAEVAGSRARALGGIDSYKDVEGVGTGLNYLGGLAAQSVPYVGEAAVGGVLTRSALTGLRATVAAGRVAGATEEAVTAARTAQKAIDFRSVAGATAASYPSSMGDILGNQREQIEISGGEMRPGMAALGAIPYSLLNAGTGVGGLAARGNLARSGVRALDDMDGFKGGLARTGAAVTRVAGAEGAGELGQEFVNQGAGRMAVDPYQKFWDDSVNPDGSPTNRNSTDRYAESFVGGAVMGGATGVIGGHRRSAGYKAPAEPVSDTQETNLLAPNDGTGPPTDLIGPGIPRQGIQTNMSGFNQEFPENQFSPINRGGVPDANVASNMAELQNLRSQKSGIVSYLQSLQDSGNQDAYYRFLDQAYPAIDKIDEAMAPLERLEAAQRDSGGQQGFDFNNAQQNQNVGDSLIPATGVGPQDLINQQLGLTRPDVAGATQKEKNKYPSLFEDAASEQTGQDISDSATDQTEFNDTALQDVQRQAGILQQQRVAQQKLEGMQKEVQAETARVAASNARGTGFGIKGKAALDVFDQLEQFFEQGRATEAEFKENASLLAQRKMGSVKKWMDAITGTKAAANSPVAVPTIAAPAALTTQENGTQTNQTVQTETQPNTQAGAQALPTKGVRTLARGTLAASQAVDPVATDAVVATADPIADEAPVAPTEFVNGVPVQKLSYVEPATGSKALDEDGLPSVAAIHEKVKGLLLANVLGQHSQTYEQFKLNLAQVTGMQVETDPETGVATVIQANNPVPMAQVAASNGTSRQAISQSLNGRGITDKLIEKLVFNANPTNSSFDPDANEQDAPTGDDTIDPTDNRAEKEYGSDAVVEDAAVNGGMRVENSAAKAMGEGLVTNDVTYSPQETKLIGNSAKAIKEAEFSQGSIDAAIEGKSDRMKNAILATAAKLQISSSRAVGTKVKTTADIAFEGKRSEAAKASYMRELALFWNGPDGANTASDWNERTAGNFPDFDQLTTAQQLNWTAGLYELTKEQTNDQEAIDALFTQLSNGVPRSTQADRSLADNARGMGTNSEPAGTSEGAGASGRPAQPAAQVTVKKTRKVAQPAIADDSRTIDGTDLVREVSEQEMLLLESGVGSLPDAQRGALEKAYGEKAGTEAFSARLREDVTNYINKGIESVSAAIRHIIKSVAEGVLAVGIVFNPTAFSNKLDLQLAQIVKTQVTSQVKTEVPANAKAKMSTQAQGVYESMAPTAAKLGKGFIIADKPMGMVHIFKADGSVLVQDAALYGKDKGDTLDSKSSLQGGPKTTPAGSFHLEAMDDKDYTGGKVLSLVESRDSTGYVAVHSVYLGDPKEQRVERFKSANPDDRRVSFGCINTTEDTFVNNVLPVINEFNGGMIFVMPEAQENTAAMFPAQTVTTEVEQAEGGVKTADARLGALGKNDEVVAEKVRLSQGNKTQSSTVARVTSEVKGLMPISSRLVVVESFADLPSHVQQSVAQQSADGKTVQGFILGGKAYLIAKNIAPGKARAVFMHEVGSHLGLDNLLSPEQHAALAAKVSEWAARNDGSRESNLAQAALARVEQAGVSEEDRNSELIAYFIEEAVNAGIDPTANSYKSDLDRWFRTVWAAFKSAMHRLGVNPDKLTAQDMVDMAYGAAKLEMNGAWHGTAAEFKKFNHKYMNSGEGAQAHGWGSYFAQAPGIAKGYFERDVKNKTGKGSIPPQGNLMRIDFNVAEDEWLDLNEKLNERNLQLLETNLPSTLKDDLVEAVNEELNEMDGRDLYRGLVFLEKLDGSVSDLFKDTEAYNAKLANKDADQIVSTYLDSIGIKGSRFLDANSRTDRRGKLFIDGQRVKALPSMEFGERDGIERLMVNDGNLTEALKEAKNEALGTQEEIKYLESLQGKEISLEGASQTQNLVVFNDENIQRVASLKGADKGKVQFSVAASPSAAAAVKSMARSVGGRSAESLAISGMHFARKAALSMESLHSLVDRFEGRIPAIRPWYNAMIATSSRRRELEASAEKVSAMATKLKDSTAVNQFISESTVDQKWGYDPGFKNRKKPVVLDAAMKQKFNRLTAPEQEVVKAVFAHGEEMSEAKNKILKTLGIDDIFTSKGKLEGPYAPLKRFGNYISILKSKELVAALDEKTGNAALADKLKSSPDNYVVTSFDTMGEAELHAKDNAADFLGGTADAFEKSVRVDADRVMNPALLAKVMAAVNASDIPTEAQAAVHSLVQDMYFQSLDEQNARTSGLKRKNRAGYEADMIRSFLSNARAEAGFLANMEHGGDINRQFYEMQKGAKDAQGKRVHQTEFNTLAAHYADSLKYTKTPWQDALMAGTAAWQLSTSPAYHLVNAMQGIMVTVPRLAADFNDYTGAWSALLAGYGTLKQTGMWGNINLSRVSNPGLRAALQKAADMGVLDVGLDEDLTRLEATRTGVAAIDRSTGLAQTALHKLRQVSRAVEMANRVSSATAGYNMSIARGDGEAAAQAYAVRLLQDTQGDFSRTDAPLILKKLPKVVTQYKKYQFMMAALYVKAFQQAFNSTDPEVKAIGRRMLAYKLFHTSMAAGALGMPLANVVGMVFAALGGDDGEPPDLERTLRELIGDEDMANILLHGPLSYLGVDLSGKLGDDKIFSILPYGTWDFSSAAGLIKTAASLAGPGVSQLGKMADGVGLIGKGELGKGTEKLMPSGIANAMKAFRIANEGFTLKNGDVMFRPEDINGMSLALDALGVPSAALKRMEWIRSQQYEISRFYTDQSSQIKQEYAAATKDGDYEVQAQLRADWMALQGGKAKMRQYFGDSQDALKAQPLTTLLKYPSTKAEREAKLQRAAQVSN
jgi:hypothetical protein